MNRRLFVIGNGFDLHHGIPSRFSDFGRHLATAAPDLSRLIEEYLFVDEDLWNDFEHRLSTFDQDAVIDHAGQFLASYGAEDWSDSGHHDFEYEIEQIVDGLSGQLRRRFAEWVRALPIPPAGSVPLVRRVDPTARFLSFNYTPTLQRLYDVPDQNVLHIHGRASDPDAAIVLGHGWERRPDELLRRLVDEDTDTRVAGGYGLIDDYFAGTFKPSEQLIEEHRARFDGLADVSEVIVLGHSLADVDAPYFRAIIDRVPPSAPWTVSCHVEPLTERARIAELGLSSSVVRFARLSDL